MSPNPDALRMPLTVQREPVDLQLDTLRKTLRQAA